MLDVFVDKDFGDLVVVPAANFGRHASRCCHPSADVRRLDSQDANSVYSPLHSAGAIKMVPFAEFFQRIALLVLTPKCYEVFFYDMDFFNGALVFVSPL